MVTVLVVRMILLLLLLLLLFFLIFVVQLSCAFMHTNTHLRYLINNTPVYSAYNSSCLFSMIFVFLCFSLEYLLIHF